MTIIIRDCKWSQDNGMVTVEVSLRGASTSDVSIFMASGYIKATYGRYLFDALLHATIDPDKSSCTIVTSKCVFELVKCEANVVWPDLHMTQLTRTERLQLIQRFVEEEQTRIQKKDADRRNRMAELKRLAVSEQISLDTVQRNEIEFLKEKEKINAFEMFRHSQPSIQARPDEKKIVNKVGTRTFTPKDPVPAVRCTASLEVSFTERHFPTPCRESRMEEENEWLRKQAEARKTVGFMGEDLRPEERNPQYLKDKGDEFYKLGNYLAAISAYSFGINLSPKFVDLYVARSATHLALGNYNKCAVDCSTALDLMKPCVAANLESRALCIGRRGVSLIKIGHFKQGLEELEASLRLKPDPYFVEQWELARKQGPMLP